MLEITQLSAGKAALTLDDVLGLLTEVERKHLPFVMAGAINTTLFDARKVVQDDLDDQFVIRRPWVRRGIRVAKADKRSQSGALYTLDWFMRDQEEGAARAPNTGQHIFRPTVDVRRGGTIQGLPKKRPKALLKQMREASAKAKSGKRRRGRRRPTPFIATMRTGKRGLFIRRGRGRKPITLLYVLERSIDIPPIWNFGSTVGRVSDKTLRRAFVSGMRRALATNRHNGKAAPKESQFFNYLDAFPDALESPVRHFGSPV